MSRLVLATLFFILTHSTFALGFKECYNGNNMIAQRLEGTWLYDEVISNILGENGDSRLKKVRFTKDSTALELFPKFDIDICTYLSGKMDLYSESFEELNKPFVLIMNHGMPYIFWLESNGLMKGESFQISLVAGKISAQDLLFLGDDHYEDDTPMTAFKRMPQ